MASITFPVGYYQLHQDVGMNFQLNRWFDWVGEKGMLDEMRAVAPRIKDYEDWKREFLALAEDASQNGHVLRAGFYYRSANFYMRTDDPDRMVAREKFLEAMQSVYGLGNRPSATQYPTPMTVSKGSCLRIVFPLPNRRAL